MTLCPASTSRRAMWAPILPRPMKPISIAVLPRLFCVDCSRHEFFAHFHRMLANCGHRAIAPRGAALLRRRRIGHRSAWRADGDAAQMRMTGELGRRVDAGKGDVGGSEFLLQRVGIECAEHGGYLAVGLGTAFDALDIGGEIWIGGERGIAENFFRQHAPFAVALDRDENVEAVAALARAVG